MRNYFDISATDDERKRREKVAGKIAILDRSLEDTLPYLFALLGIVEGDDPLAQMDGQIKKRRTLEAIKRIVLRESLNQPLMVIFEDLHWIDDETQELLNLLADSIGTAKVLLLERAPEHMRGGNTRHTRNIRCAHTAAYRYQSGSYSEEEFLEDLVDVTGGPANLDLAKSTVRESRKLPQWMSEHGACWQPPLAGTLHLEGVPRGAAVPARPALLDAGDGEADAGLGAPGRPR